MLSDRASMVYVCTLTMTFLFHLEGVDDLMKIGFLRPLYWWRHFRWRLSAIRDNLLHCCLSCRYYIYQTPHSVLGSMLHGSETTAKNIGQHLPRLLWTIHCFINYKTFMENIHGDSLPDNYKEYAFSVQHPLQADVKPKSFVLAPHIYAPPLVVDCPSTNSTCIAI